MKKLDCICPACGKHFSSTDAFDAHRYWTGEDRNQHPTYGRGCRLTEKHYQDHRGYWALDYGKH